MPVAIAIGAAAVVGGAASVISGNKAAKAQTDAANLSVNEQRRQYDTTRADYAPWRAAGEGALGKLSALYGVDGKPADPTAVSAAYDQFRATPGYQFQIDEGTKAVQRSAAARGMLGSGGTMKALTRYAGGLADQTYGQYVGQLQSLAGLGQSATGATTQAGQNATNSISNAYMQAGNARASSYANTGAEISKGVNSLAGQYLYGKGYTGG